MIIEPVAYYRGPVGSKFGLPRQSGLAASLEGRIVFTETYRDVNAVRGLEGFDRIWLIWGFSANKPAKGVWQPTVRPPRLGGNRSMGVWATRSPFRPNPLGLSAVRLVRTEITTDEGPVLHVSGADLMDGTPVYDIKPYIAYADAFPDAAKGFVNGAPEPPFPRLGGTLSGNCWNWIPVRLTRRDLTERTAFFSMAIMSALPLSIIY